MRRKGTRNEQNQIAVSLSNNLQERKKTKNDLKKKSVQSV